MMMSIAQQLVAIRPSERQLNWHELRFYAFVCFGPNTFYDCEWGTGKEDPRAFNPTDLDTDQWVESIQAAGMKGIILTCKHHDGFCLWPSKYTEQSVKNSPYKQGKGDIVGELATSCAKYGIKFGIYLSPWDMHEVTYGTEAYNDYFVNQLVELLTEYGEIFSVWFDGASGEGQNGKQQVYDWQRYEQTIRKYQPNAVISVCGVDVRWCGNEAGDCRTSEWSVVPKRLADPQYVAENSQHEASEAFRMQPIKHGDEDLGSRERLKNEEELIWYPAEVDTSIRPGWYYHQSEDNKVRSLEALMTIYYQSVGGNATLLLNVPPDQRGLIHEKDVERLREMGVMIKAIFANNIAPSAQIMGSKSEAGYEMIHVLEKDDKYFKGIEGEEQAEVILRWDKASAIGHVILEEQLSESQRIEAFAIYALKENGLECVYEGTTVGSCRMCKLEGVYTSEIRIQIMQSRVTPTLRFLGVYTQGDI